MKKIIVVISLIFVMIFGLKVYGAIIANDLVDPYPGNGKMIEANVTDGAAFFLQAQGTISGLLWEAETGSKGELNSGNCINYIDAAILNLNCAKEKILAAVAMSKTSTVDDTKIAMLKSFDYETLIAQKALVREIMMEVKTYLAEGNIPGFYQKFVNGLDEMIKHLQAMKDKFNANNPPAIDDYWHLLNLNNHISLFGNYGTVVGQTAIK